MNIRGAFLHVLNDAIGSVIVILAGVAMKLWPDLKWVNYIDPLASLFMISMIIVFTIPLCKLDLFLKKRIIYEINLVRESALVLLQTAPMHIEVADLQKRLVEQVIIG